MFNKKIHKRIKITLIIIIICFILIIGKVFYIQVIDYNKLNNLANNLWSRNLTIGANRGKIITSDNVTVADNLTTVSLVVIPNQIDGKDIVSIGENAFINNSTMKALKDANGFIRRELMNRVEMRHIPELEFIYDESIEYGKKIEDIIERINNGK